MQELGSFPDPFGMDELQRYEKSFPLPSGLKNREHLARRVNTWDMTGMQIYDNVYNASAQPYELEIREGFLVPVTPLDRLQKAAISTSTAAAYNALYGAIAIIQISQQQNAFGMLPKRGYPKEGFRASSAAAYTSSVGIAEGSAVGTPQVPTYQEITVGLKEVEGVTEFTQRMEVVSAKNDNIEYAGNAQIVFSNFMDALDVDLLQDFDTLAGNDIESIDRVTASTSEQAGVGATAGDEDLYGVDRSANSWWDSNALHNSAVDRNATKPLLDTLQNNQWEFWQNNVDEKVYLTGTDTWSEYSAIEGARQRFGEDTFTNTINGITTFPGQTGGYKLTTYDGHPWILDQNVQADTISRLYLLDLVHLGVVLGRPIQFIESDNPFEVGYNHRGLWYGICELWNDLSASHGKLRDLQGA